MSDFEKIRTLQAMVIHLTQRIEKLEGRTRLTSTETYYRELKNAADGILAHWN